MPLETVRFDKERRVAKVYRWGNLVDEWHQTPRGWIAYGALDGSEKRVAARLDAIRAKYPWRSNA